MNRIIAVILLCGLILSGCGAAAAAVDDGRVRVVATLFTPYDFTREVAGGLAYITMLLPPGGDAKSFEPTPQDIMRIKNSDIFIHVGGEPWVYRILASISTSEMTIIRMIDKVELLYEDTAGLPHNYNPGWCYVCPKESGYFSNSVFDEHVWTTPGNAILIVQSIARALAEADPYNAYLYAKNAADYIRHLHVLDAAFREVVESGVRNTIIFGDRFAFRYFAHDYGLEYFAAIPGCRGTTEPSAATVMFLIDKINYKNIPVVFHAEMSDQRLANTIAEATGAKVLLLHAGHNISRDEFLSGVTYLELMNQNVEALREALN